MQTLKIILLIGFTFVAASMLRAQRLILGYGTATSLITGKIAYNSGASNIVMPQFGLCFSPRFILVGMENSSVSIGTPVAVGLGLIPKSYKDDSGVYFTYELPIVLDYNIGRKSTAGNDKKTGMYFGSGFSYSKLGLAHGSYPHFNGETYGPLLRAGYRFNSIWKIHSKHTGVLGLSYRKGLEKDGLNSFTYSVCVDL